MNPNEPLPVVIYDAPTPSSSGCACGCGGHDHPDHHDHVPQVSLEIQAKALAMTLESAFPGKVRVEYINVLKDPRGPDLPVTPLLTSLTYPPPLVYIGGRGRFAGALDPERIMEEVAKCLEPAAG